MLGNVAVGDIRRLGLLVFRAGAISNFIVTVPAFVVYDRYVGTFLGTLPNYPFLIWIWSGMAFLWGVMFFEVSSDVIERRPMLKYTWLEKSVTSASVLVAFLTLNVPAAALIGVVFTDMIWIPAFVAVHVGVARLALAGSG
jgi:hypothetical protein